jgi:hypothetical protein
MKMQATNGPFDESTPPPVRPASFYPIRRVAREAVVGQSDVSMRFRRFSMKTPMARMTMATRVPARYKELTVLDDDPDGASHHRRRNPKPNMTPKMEPKRIHLLGASHFHQGLVRSVTATGCRKSVEEMCFLRN